MVDTRKLKARIVEQGLTQKEVRTMMGLTKRQFEIRIEKKNFDAEEIYKLLDILEIDDPKPIFFAAEVTR